MLRGEPVVEIGLQRQITQCAVHENLQPKIP